MSTCRSIRPRILITAHHAVFGRLTYHLISHTLQAIVTASQAQRAGADANVSCRDAIMDTAEELFAERGLDGVSLREINTVAGYSAAALHYHFETRDGLVRALLARAQPPMFTDREAAFERLRSLEAVTPVDVVNALVRPLALGMDRQPRESARRLRFLSRLYFDRSPYMRGMFEESFALFLPFLERALPGLDQTSIRQRWVFAVELAQHALGHAAEMSVTDNIRGRRPARALESYLQGLVRFIVGGLNEECSVETRRPSVTGATSSTVSTRR
jgi:AcrR family transcriptional regulator